jgi:chemotaxis signal transduction protein
MLAAKVKVATLKVLVFRVGTLYLALRLEGVKKVTPMPNILKSGDKFLGITQMEGEEVIVFDLYQKIYDRPAQESQGFLVTVQTNQNRYGITAAILPIMREIPLSEFRAVPADYRDRDTLGIADQMVEVTLDNKTVVTAFLLDPEQLLAAINSPKL